MTTFRFILLVILLLTPACTTGEWTALHHAAKCGEHAEVKKLLEGGADVNAKDKDGDTPLRIAVGRGHYKKVKHLLEGGADAEAKDKDGWTALHFAAKSGLPVAYVLIEHGADVGAREKHGWTPLHVAAYHGRADIVKWLLEAGADAEARNEKGETPRDVNEYRMGINRKYGWLNSQHEAIQRLLRQPRTEQP